MKRRARVRRVWLAALWLAGAPAHADQIALGVGGGHTHSNRSDAVLLDYRRTASTLFGLESFYEFAFASWNGPNANEALSVGRELRWPGGGRGYLTGAFGVGYVSSTTGTLGSHLQFRIRAGAGWRAGKYDVSLANVHYSNGEGVTGLGRPNLGENFLSLSVAREF